MTAGLFVVYFEKGLRIVPLCNDWGVEVENVMFSASQFGCYAACLRLMNIEPVNSKQSI